ncbi:MAG: hypothetical protein E4G89_05960, partial [Methanothrix sp.]
MLNDLTIEQAMLTTSIGLVLATFALGWFTRKLVKVTRELNVIEMKRDESIKADRERANLETGIAYANQIIA